MIRSQGTRGEEYLSPVQHSFGGETQEEKETCVRARASARAISIAHAQHARKDFSLASFLSLGKQRLRAEYMHSWFEKLQVFGAN